MARPRGNRKTARLTVTLDEQVHTTLSTIAQRQDASLAWVMRRAAAEFIDRHSQLAQPELPLRRTGSGSTGRADLPRGLEQ